MSLVPSTRLSSIYPVKSDGMVTFGEGSKVTISQSCRNHIGVDIKSLCSKLVIDFRSKETSRIDS